MIGEILLTVISVFFIVVFVVATVCVAVAAYRFVRW